MKDIDYKKTLASHLGIFDLNCLKSIVGENEFKNYIETLPECAYKPGNRLDFNKIDSFDFANIHSNKFLANLHLHTNYSDGAASVSQILENAVKIADENVRNGSFGFLLAITDHDTIDGVKEALRLISESPDKYKNLKLVLGVEISTVALNFLNQTKTLDIHTLFYCINPFNRFLDNFLKEKIQLKYKLACETLMELNRDLAPVLNKLNIILNLNEASKIHPMILKGQDEVSHPLKKYIYAEILFTYYVKNNPEILQMLKESGVDKSFLSYEKPVFKYKNMFNNERYFYIYKDSLQKYLNLITDNKYEFVLPDIPQNIVDYLLKGKYICENSHPTKYKHLEAFSYFEETLEFLNSLDYGVISIAHPARINVKNVDSSVFEFFREFWRIYKEHGKNKAFAYEKYYQSYRGSAKFDMLKDINSSAALYNLASTGGVDSHGDCVFCRV